MLVEKYSDEATYLNLICSNLTSYLRNEYGNAIYKSWLSHLTFEEVKNGILILTVPTKFIREWVLANYFSTIENFVKKIDASIIKIELKVRPARARAVYNNAAETNKPNNENENNLFEVCLDPRFTFDYFICGDSNKIAYSAAKSVIQSWQSSSHNNILFIQSKVGLGKTHLLQSIAAYALENYPNKKIAYLNAEKFMHLYTKSARDNNLINFREKLRSLDVLLVDDIQFICGKSGTEQEFINTFNALTESNRKVIVSSDASPYNLNLDIRSKSRLAGGLVVTINQPDYELRLNVLRSKIQQLKVSIEDSILDLIAKNITSNVRELEGALNKLVSYCSIFNYDISLVHAQEILKDNLAAHEKTLSIDTIIKVVANYYSLKNDEILSKSRTARLVLPRQVAIFIAKQLTRLSLQEIGHKIGDRDHATVIYSVKKLEERISYDKNLSNDVGKIIELLGN